MTVHDLRDFTTDRHRVVDDVPYGGGPGMVLKPEPIFRALDAIEAERGTAADGRADVAAGQAVHAGRGAAAEPAARTSCCCAAATKGVDERVRERVDEELSIGDYVLSGGELPALVDRRRGRAAGAGRGRRRAVGGGGFVQPRAARFSALHAAGGADVAGRRAAE